MKRTRLAAPGCALLLSLALSHTRIHQHTERDTHTHTHRHGFFVLPYFTQETPGGPCKTNAQVDSVSLKAARAGQAMRGDAIHLLFAGLCAVVATDAAAAAALLVLL